MTSSLIKRLSELLPVLGIALLIYIISQIDREQLINILKKLDVQSIVFASAIFALNLFSRAFRWHRLLRITGIQAKLVDVCIYYLCSMFYGSITFGRLGELYRVKLLQKPLYKNQDKSPGTDFSLFVSVVDRVLDILFMALVSIFLTAFFIDVSSLKFSILIILVPIFLIAILVISLSDILYNKYAQKQQHHNSETFFRKSLLRLLSLMKLFSLLSGFKARLELLAYTCFSWALYLLTCYILAVGLNMSISTELLLLALFLAILVSLLPITFQGFGTREIVFITIFNLVGISKEAAVSLSISFVLTIFVTSIFLGSIAMLFEKFYDTSKTNSKISE